MIDHLINLSQMDKIVMNYSVVELFAGVGGFRLGFERASQSSDSTFDVVWSNQWEPSTKVQHASDIYCERWNLKESEDMSNTYHSAGGDIHTNMDIATVNAKDIPNHDILCGGFPCQDYSVAKTLNQATGIQGKKGVLWWEILRITKSKSPSLLILENVDRLLKSPAKQRGRDFAVMLKSLDDLGYVVEWRIINSAEYGFPQRRKRVFIIAHHERTKTAKRIRKSENRSSFITEKGYLASAFPVDSLEMFAREFQVAREGSDLADLSEEFNTTSKKNSPSLFENSGIMVDNMVYTGKTKEKFSGIKSTLNDVLVTPSKVPDEFILTAESLLKPKGWIYLKGAKKNELRQGTDGFTYNYNEGPVTFPDSLSRASRTIITGEGGSGPSRFKHVVTFKPTNDQIKNLGLDSEECSIVRNKLELNSNEWLRRLVPIELERLNGFPDDHTTGATDGKRAFFMGNALVVGIIEKIAKQIDL